MSTHKLTELQRRFVEAYMGAAKGNATEAARIAGYKGDDKSLAATASRLLRNVKVLAAIDERVASDPLVLDREKLQKFWTRVVLGVELDRGEEPEMKDRLKASELLGRSQGAFIERVEHSVDDASAEEIARILGVSLGDDGA